MLSALSSPETLTLPFFTSTAALVAESVPATSTAAGRLDFFRRVVVLAEDDAAGHEKDAEGIVTAAELPGVLDAVSCVFPRAEGLFDEGLEQTLINWP